MRTIFGQKLRFVLCLSVLFMFVAPLFAQRIDIKLASLVPENTAWGQAINRLAAEWMRISNGQINVTVYHGGTAGTETTVLMMLRSNQLQAGVFTSMGLNQITPEVMAFSYPFLIRSDTEYHAVMGKLRSELDAKMQQNGFVTIAWAHAGWIKLFTRTPITTPADLRALRMGTGTDDPSMVRAFEELSYRIVPSELTEQLFSLQSNRIDAVYNSPIYIAGNQLFGIAGNMSSVNVAPFMGGILVNNVTWRRITRTLSPAVVEQLKQVCKRLEVEIGNSISALEADAVSTMVRHGLKVNELTAAQAQVWYDDTARYENRLIGGSRPIFNREYYIKIRDILNEYRASRGQ
ncbi:MAG: TRAP transporter substrate-binding protein DctP [Treponema sp.]|nr:TRAP transporter substrate-binding protein DctP [Treponema sp.]